MEINLYLRTLQRGWWIIVVVMLAALNISLLVSYLTPPVYETNARYVVSPNAGVYNNTWDIVDSLDTLDRRSIINTYKELLASPSIYGKALELQDIDPNVLATDYSVSVVVVPDTNILKLTVDGPNPDMVVKIANAIGAEALDYVNNLYPVYNFSILDSPERPTAPVRPEPVKNAGLALLVGAILGVGLAFSREQLQSVFDRLKERSLVDSVTGAFTRVQFERRLREVITQNPESSLALGIINFKGIEEAYNVFPQVVIDRVLNKVTQKLKNELRGRDIVGRWDQAKLSVMLPAAPNSAVESTFKRIQKYLEEPIRLNESGDVDIRPDPCIGVVARDQFESIESLVKRAETAAEQATAFGTPTVVFLSTPFILYDENESS